jgi:hypothetical protein
MDEVKHIGMVPLGHSQRAMQAIQRSTKMCGNCGKMVQTRHHRRHYAYCTRSAAVPDPEAELDLQSRQHKLCKMCGKGIVPNALSHLPCFKCEDKDPVFQELDRAIEVEKAKHKIADLTFQQAIETKGQEWTDSSQESGNLLPGLS